MIEKFVATMERLDRLVADGELRVAHSRLTSAVVRDVGDEWTDSSELAGLASVKSSFEPSGHSE
jgi:hypothetical protein